jgi:hypothetical protein
VKRQAPRGLVDNIIIAPDKAVRTRLSAPADSLDLGKHDVAIPVNQLKQEDGKFILPGATKNALKEMPRFEYAKSR